MSNIADIIEAYILRKLSDEKKDIVVLRRNELAEEIECAPSQISYVLSTRFTVQRGFVVESRRGLGGFVRIARVPIQHIIYQDITNQIDEDTTPADIEATIHNLVRHGLMSNREAALVLQFATFTFEKSSPPERVQVLKTIFQTLADFE